MMRRMLLPALFAALLAAPRPVAAQADGWTAAVGAALEAYRFAQPQAAGIRTLSLVSAPFTARGPVAGPVWLSLSGSYARGVLEQADGSKVTISGLTDSQLQISAVVVPRLASVSVIALLPTGTSELSLAQAELAGAVSADLLPFRVSHWGSGGALGVGTTIARNLGAVGLGASAAYVVGRSFDYLADQPFALRPGNELQLRLALDAAAGASGKLGLQLLYQHNAEDEINGQNLFRPGDRFQARGSYAFTAGGGSAAIVYGGLLHRASGLFLGATAERSPDENLAFGGAGLRAPVGRGVLAPAIDARLARRSDGLEQGYTVGVGSSLEWPLGAGRLRLVPSARVRFGHLIVRQGQESGFSGVDLGLGLRFGGAE